MARTVLNSF